MPKYFEYEDPEMASHVNKMVGAAMDAEENGTIARDTQDRPKEYAINNRDKPFSPVSNDDAEHRCSLAAGGGRDKFIVAKHRAEHDKFMEKYNRMADRNTEGNFHISTAHHAKIAKVVMEEENKQQNGLGYLERIKAAISLSKAAKEKRAEKKELKKAAEKIIETAEELDKSE